jgi:uncharacterized SAM-binding protein YcdF (DUF218 family)
MNPFIESFFLPPGLFVLVGIISLALCSRWTGRLLLVLNLSALYLLSTPVVGTHLMNSLELSKAVSETEIRAFQPQVILVPLAGRQEQAPEYGGPTVDSLSLERLRYGAYLHRRTGLPILLSGGSQKQPVPTTVELGRRVLEQEFQLPMTALETETDSSRGDGQPRTTLPERIGDKRVLVVTQAWQMKRTSERLRAQGLDILEAPTVITLPTANARNPKRWVPRLWALELSKRFMQERLGEIGYRLTSFLG